MNIHGCDTAVFVLERFKDDSKTLGPQKYLPPSKLADLELEEDT